MTVLHPLRSSTHYNCAHGARPERGPNVDKKEAIDRRADIVEEVKRIAASAAGRSLTKSQGANIKRLVAEFDELAPAAGGKTLQQLGEEFGDGPISDGTIVNLDDEVLRSYRPSCPMAKSSSRLARTAGGIVVLKPSDRLADVARDWSAPQDGMKFDRWLRGIVTGNWSGAEIEASMSITTPGSGGYLVPTPLSTRLIDMARNQARVLQAGAMTVPMESATLKMGRLAGDPTAAWKAENAVSTASDMTFEQVEFTAHTLIARVKASVELIEDATGLEGTIERSLAAALGLELDRAALRGSGTPPEPDGILNQTGVTVTAIDNVPSYTMFSEAVDAIRAYNFEPNAAIFAPRTAGYLDRLVDDNKQPLRPLPSFEALTRLTTNQIPTNLGTGQNASEAYIADWSQLMLGVRTQLVIEVSRDASDANDDAWSQLQVWIRAYLRADVQLAQPKAFVVLTGLVPTAPAG